MLTEPQKHGFWAPLAAVVNTAFPRTVRVASSPIVRVNGPRRAGQFVK
jgi:hypothetical protein